MISPYQRWGLYKLAAFLHFPKPNGLEDASFFLKAHSLAGCELQLFLNWSCENIFCIGDVNSISVGSGTNIQDNSLVHVAKSNLSGKVLPTIIGDNVTVGEWYAGHDMHDLKII